jgi:hypothetical protein
MLSQCDKSCPQGIFLKKVWWVKSGALKKWDNLPGAGRHGRLFIFYHQGKRMSGRKCPLDYSEKWPILVFFVGNIVGK